MCVSTMMLCAESRSDPVDVYVRRLHAGGGLHADLEAQFLDGLAGQEGDQAVRARLGLDLGSDVAELDRGDDAGERVADRGVGDVPLAVARPGQLDRERGEVPAVDEPPSRLVAVSCHPA